MASSLALLSRLSLQLAGLRKLVILKQSIRLVSVSSNKNIFWIGSEYRDAPSRYRTVFMPVALKHTTTKYSRGKDGKQQSEDDDDDESDSTDISGIDPGILSDVDGKDVKVMKSKLNSLRLDTVLKAGLGTAKHKVDTAFYESRIRVNGEKVLKKSKRLEVGDEVDLIKGLSVMNPAFLDVGRVMIIAADYIPEKEKISVVLKRYRTLTVENYEYAPYKGVSPE